VPALILQDFIRQALERERDAFCREVAVPVLISEFPPAGFALREAQTRLLKTDKRSPLARSLILKGHQLPAREVRQVRPGPSGQVTQGRLPDNDVVIADPTVSSHHATFVGDVRTGTCQLQDIGSSNGTLVNNRPLVVGKPEVLFDGDLLTFGDSSHLFFYPGGLYDVIRANLEDP
jgi:pSer/pThr/pTyr-binding forkhead associated (FHA) protein